jgi:sarcosine oxidase
MAVGSRTEVDVVVVGRGAVAGAAAWQLARDGVDVLLLSHPGVGSPPSEVTVPTRSGGPEPAVGLAAVAAPMWREVEAETGASLLSLTGGVDHGDRARTVAVADALASHDIGYTWIDPEEARHRWPGMVFRGPVLYQPDRTGRVRAAQAARALLAAAVGHGATVDSQVPVTGVAVRGRDRVVLTTEDGSVRARRVVIAAGAASARLLPPEVIAPLWEIQERIAGFPPLGINPCIPRENNWPIFVHHTGPADGWPAPVHGTPDPCGDVMVAFDGARNCPPLRELQDYVERMLPGLDSTSPVLVEGTRTETSDRRPVLAAAGPVVMGAGFAGKGTAFAPALGRVLADLALTDPGLARSVRAARDAQAGRSRARSHGPLDSRHTTVRTTA